MHVHPVHIMLVYICIANKVLFACECFVTAHAEIGLVVFSYLYFDVCSARQFVDKYLFSRGGGH